MKLVDTSVLVEIDRGNEQGKVERLDREGRHVISSVSATEKLLGVERLYSGTEEYSRRKQAMSDLLSRFELAPVDWPVASEASKIIQELRSDGRPLDDLHEIYKGATARNRDLAVLTSNIKDFERIENLNVINWSDY